MTTLTQSTRSNYRDIYVNKYVDLKKENKIRGFRKKKKKEQISRQMNCKRVLMKS